MVNVYIYGMTRVQVGGLAINSFDKILQKSKRSAKCMNMRAMIDLATKKYTSLGSHLRF